MLSSRMCVIPLCDEKATVRGHCRPHSLRMTKLCLSPECNEIFYGKQEYCPKHRKMKNHAEWTTQNKEIIFNYFGRTCINCGEGDIDVLQLDHKNNKGYLDKDKSGNSNTVYYKIIRDIKNKVNLKGKYQTLCANCNIKKRRIYQEFMRLEKLGIPPF